VDGEGSDDWKDIPPQPVFGGDTAPTLAEAAWFPFKKFDEGIPKGFANAYLAYDKSNFYFAARSPMTRRKDGMMRFATRNDDEFFYPQKSEMIDDTHEPAEEGRNLECHRRRHRRFAEAGRRAHRVVLEQPSAVFCDRPEICRRKTSQVSFYLMDVDNYEHGPGAMWKSYVLDTITGKFRCF